MANIILSREVTIHGVGHHINKNSKPVYCLTDGGKPFASVTDAAKYAGVTVQVMSNHLCGRNKTCKGKKYSFTRDRDQHFEETLHRTTSLLDELAALKKANAIMLERLKKLDAIEAEQEAVRKAEEKKQQHIERLVKRYGIHHKRYDSAVTNLAAIERELIELTGDLDCIKELLKGN